MYFWKHKKILPHYFSAYNLLNIKKLIVEFLTWNW
jgi:hypothetical protein